MAWRVIDQPTARKVVIAARRAGRTLAAAAAAAGVHTATVCRWQAADRKFARAVREAHTAANRDRYAARAAERVSGIATRNAGCDPMARKPVVAFHPLCPTCGAPSVVRRVGYGFRVRFWGCSRWPWCSWASWRPRCPEDCPACGGAMFWSCGRRSVSCPACRTRYRPQRGARPCE